MTSTSVEPSTSSARTESQDDSRRDRRTYDQILRSTALVGGASAVNIAFNIVRTKVMALLLGPAGVGWMGVYNSISDLAFSVAGLGVNSSGVRQIAEAVGTGDAARISRTVTVLRRVSVVLGIAGGGVLLAAAGPVSEFTFGSRAQVSGVALLSIAVFFRLVSAGQGALIQGLRRISELARMNVAGAFWGTVASIALVSVFRERGIIPSLVAVAAITCLISWWYARRVEVVPCTMSTAQIGAEAAALLKLGFAFMASAMLTMGAGYAVRLIVLRQVGIDAAGLYQSAWALGGLYVGFILQAMGADFYPRLTTVANDHSECNRLVNEQALIGLLIGGPGVLATLTFAPVVVRLFYSPEFAPAVDVLRWICLGMTLRVVAWPMGFILLAKNAQAAFFWTEVAATAVHVGLAALFVNRFGVAGAGAAFFGLYVWHGLVIFAIVRRLTGFRWTRENMIVGGTYLPVTMAVYCAFLWLPWWTAAPLGAAAAFASALYSCRAILSLIPPDRVPAMVSRVLGSGSRARFAARPR